MTLEELGKIYDACNLTPDEATPEQLADAISEWLMELVKAERENERLAERLDNALKWANINGHTTLREILEK